MIRSISLTFLILSLIPSCHQNNQRPAVPQTTISASNILSRYDPLRTGMIKVQVEAVLGQPISSITNHQGHTEECWYIDKSERGLEWHESPWGIGGIVVTYKDGKLNDKKYNHQWVQKKDMDLYEAK